MCIEYFLSTIRTFFSIYKRENFTLQKNVFLEKQKQQKQKKKRKKKPLQIK